MVEELGIMGGAEADGEESGLDQAGLLLHDVELQVQPPLIVSSLPVSEEYH